MRIIATTLMVGTLLSVPYCVHARTWYITPDGTGDAPTIQAGIDSADVGETVLLAAGAYTGIGNRDIVFRGKAITVTSESGRDVTIIDCQGLGRGFVFTGPEGPSSVLSGVTIHNGHNDASGGGILCLNASSPTITNNTIRGNSAQYGGGIQCRDSSPIITNNSISGNTADVGAGIWCDLAFPTISNNTISDNSASHDCGGIGCHLYSAPTISGNTISGNSANGTGGGICCFESSPAITNNLISGNSAGTYAGGIRCYYSSPTITNNTISGNSVGTFAGGMCCEYSSPSIGNTIIAFSNEGEGIYCWSSNPTLTICDIYGNAGGDWIGCIADEYGVNGNISENPLFCGESVYPSDPYRLDIASPCEPRNSLGGVLIGARPAGCSGLVSVEPTTWGRVKAIYR